MRPFDLFGRTENSAQYRDVRRAGSYRAAVAVANESSLQITSISVATMACLWVFLAAMLAKIEIFSGLLARLAVGS